MNASRRADSTPSIFLAPRLCKRCLRRIKTAEFLVGFRHSHAWCRRSRGARSAAYPTGETNDWTTRLQDLRESYRTKPSRIRGIQIDATIINTLSNSFWDSRNPGRPASFAYRSAIRRSGATRNSTTLASSRLIGTHKTQPGSEIRNAFRFGIVASGTPLMREYPLSRLSGTIVPPSTRTDKYTTR